jgi:2,4-dienoyl-CoA reductase-like NADH-dependent reductase (Old Yellow Enzyme family)
MDKVSVLLDKQSIKNYTFNNRYVCAPFDISKADEDGLVTDELLEIYKERRGPSLIIVEQAVVRSDGQYREKLIFIDRDECIEGLSKLAGVIHNNKQVAVIQINHAGSSADISLTGRQDLAPSAVMHPRVNNSMPREMSKGEIHEITEAFAEAAMRAKKAGFDGVEIHNCHGFLLTQFLSPITNKRTDEYGGSLENRSRMLMETVRAVRRAIGEELLLLVRLGVDDLLPCGLTLEEGCIVARELEKSGIDIIDISTGLLSPLRLPGPAMIRDMIKKVKMHVSIPVIGSGELADIHIAEDMVDNGEVDFIALGRPIMEQPNFVEILLKKLRDMHS